MTSPLLLIALFVFKNAFCFAAHIRYCLKHAVSMRQKSQLKCLSKCCVAFTDKEVTVVTSVLVILEVKSGSRSSQIVFYTKCLLKSVFYIGTHQKTYTLISVNGQYQLNRKLCGFFKRKKSEQQTLECRNLKRENVK